MSKSSPKADAARRVSAARRLTPTLMLPERTIGAWRAAAVDPVEIVVAQAGRADDVGDTRLRCEPRESDARSGRGEIDDRVGIEQQWQRIGHDLKPLRRTTCEQRRVLAKPRRIFTLERAGEPEPVRLMDRPDDHAPHAAGGAAHNQPSSRPFPGFPDPPSARLRAIVAFDDHDIRVAGGVANFRGLSIFL